VVGYGGRVARGRIDRRGWRLLGPLAGLLALGLLAAPNAGAYVYWADFEGSGGDSLGRAKLDGSSATPGFIAGADGPCGVAVDAHHLYWANWAFGGDASIGRANLNGSGVEQDFIDVADGSAPCGVAVDGSHVYWADSGFGSGNRIGRADLDGGNVDQAFITLAGAPGPCGIAVDATHVYWANNAFDTIGRSDLGGIYVEENLIAGAADHPCGVAVDSQHLYWANGFTGSSIGRAALDGADPVQDFIPIPGAAAPCGVAVDSGHVYWASVAAGTVGRAGLDGSGADNGFLEAPSGPCGVAVDSLPPPSNRFRFLRVRRLPRSGRARLILALPGPGLLRLGGPRLRHRKLRVSGRTARLAIVARGRFRRRLLAVGKVKVRAFVTYTPNGGTSRRKSKLIELRKRLGGG
jgi:virginiamycin B lyase